MPRAIFDANLYLNLLLSPDPDNSAVGQLLRFAADLVFELLLAEDVEAELRDVATRRPYLATRISQEALDRQFNEIAEFAIRLPLLEQEPPRISRDARDDYLLALAVLNVADYVVTRDRDLLDLGDVGAVRIVDPVAFLALLRARQGESDVD
jgi:predicted nucleic acid-binding protein